MWCDVMCITLTLLHVTPLCVGKAGDLTTHSWLHSPDCHLFLLLLLQQSCVLLLLLLLLLRR